MVHVMFVNGGIIWLGIDWRLATMIGLAKKLPQSLTMDMFSSLLSQSRRTAFRVDTNKINQAGISTAHIISSPR